MDAHLSAALPPPISDPAASPGPGAVRDADGTWRLRVWSPLSPRIEVVPESAPAQALHAAGGGWWELSGAAAAWLRPGARYRLRLPDGGEIPDPASRWQPEGVAGPSAVHDPRAFPWTVDDWRGIALEDLVTYELHLGAFTRAGTADAAIDRLGELADLGVTAVELMPVAQCPGERNWGYDGVLPFAVQHSLGGPDALLRLVDACHARGLAVILDVVYNHLGPEGSVLGRCMPFFTDRYRTPWGDAVNVDGRHSDGVRAFLLANARHWLVDCRIDGLRLDAVHAITDVSARPFLAQLADAARAWSAQTGRRMHLIAESDLNASRVIRPPAAGGYGMDAQWADDFHHALHALLTGERHAHFADFGTVDDLVRALRDGYAYAGRWSRFRAMTHGDRADDLPTSSFVVCMQNHDQIGNRAGGERIAALTDAAGLRCAAAATLLSPYLPLLFMGEEWGAREPFLYFADSADEELRRAVRAGRAREFAAFHGDGAPPDPYDPATRDASVPDPAAAGEDGRRLRAFYRACLAERRARPSLRPGPRAGMAVSQPHPCVVSIERQRGACRTLLLLNPTGEEASPVLLPPGCWEVVLDSAAAPWTAADAAGGVGLPAAGPGLAPGAAAAPAPGWLRLPARSAVLLAALPPARGEPA